MIASARQDGFPQFDFTERDSFPGAIPSGTALNIFLSISSRLITATKRLWDLI